MKHPIIAFRKTEHKRVAHGHPWAYSNEITMDEKAKALPSGSIVELQDAGGGFLGYAHFNPHTLIAARVLSRDRAAVMDTSFWQEKLASALRLRDTLVSEPYYRLVHAEADGLPGLIIDRFNDVLVMQPNTAGMHAAREHLTQALRNLLNPRAIILRGDTAARKQEGLEEEVSLLHGETPAQMDVRENGFAYEADLMGGQKTGWFYDQRRNRALVASLAKGKSVCDLYSHTGGFGLLAAKAGAKSVLCVDRSESSLKLAQTAAEKQKLTQVSFERAEVFDFCEGHKDTTYDVVIADPPAFAKSRKDVPVASKGYRKLAGLSAGLTAPSGFLFIASCSHAITHERFEEEVLRGVAQAGRNARVLARVGADMDHPAHPQLPESVYLKGLLLHVE
jgi:23S rRNA (cytosine1962-C5)-methyltransferase